MSRKLTDPSVRISERSLANLKPWKPGQSGNPGGRPVGIRDKLQKDFLADLSAAWASDGKKAIADMIETDPSGFVKVVAGLLPKEMKIETPTDGLTDEQLAAAIDFWESVTDSASSEAGPVETPSADSTH